MEKVMFFLLIIEVQDSSIKVFYVLQCWIDSSQKTCNSRGPADFFMQGCKMQFTYGFDVVSLRSYFFLKTALRFLNSPQK